MYYLFIGLTFVVSGLVTNAIWLWIQYILYMRSSKKIYKLRQQLTEALQKDFADLMSEEFTDSKKTKEENFH